MYFTNPTKSAQVREYMRAGVLGFIDTPKQQNIRPADIAWCADNGCFGKGYPGDDRWLAWLDKHSGDADTCWFATAPDVVGNAAATLERSRPYLPKIRALGYRAALVAQDGLDELEIPWSEFDVLFLGGTDEFKLGSICAEITTEAVERGKRVHCGRVNSYKRLSYARRIGCSSADGTFITYAPDHNLGRMMRWYDKLELENNR